MLVLRKAPCHSSPRVTYQILRWLRTSHDPDASAEHKTPEQVTVTKLNFSDLPTSRVLPDGSHAPPIGEWVGGLGPNKGFRRHENPSGSCIHSNLANIGTNTCGNSVI
jgi:hypothetical protein